MEAFSIGLLVRPFVCPTGYPSIDPLVTLMDATDATSNTSMDVVKSVLKIKLVLDKVEISEISLKNSLKRKIIQLGLFEMFQKSSDERFLFMNDAKIKIMIIFSVLTFWAAASKHYVPRGRHLRTKKITQALLT